MSGDAVVRPVPQLLLLGDPSVPVCVDGACMVPVVREDEHADRS